MEEKSEWKWESDECLQALFTLFERGDSLSVMATALAIQYEKAPTTASILSRLKGESVRKRLNALFGDERTIYAYAAFSARATGTVRGIAMTRRPGVAALLRPLEPDEMADALFWQGRERRLA